MPNKLSQFWQELKRRNVVRVITVYAGAAFVIIELINNITEPLRLPEWTPTLVIVLLAIGLPVAIIFSWIYDFQPEGGMVKTKPADKIKAENLPKSSSGWRIASYISFVVIVGLIVLNIIPRSGKNEILDKSIAVLPFRNDSPDEEKMYFINGSMEAILDNLCRIGDLRVPGRTAVEQYRDMGKPIPEIAEELEVSYILEGSGQRTGNRIRLYVQLLNGKDGYHIWSKQYDRVIEKIEDLIDIQSEIAQLVAAEIEAIISPDEKQLIEKVPTTSLTAYEVYQKGNDEYWNYIYNFDTKALETAEILFKAAIEFDTGFALAYSGLAKVNLERLLNRDMLEENYLDTVLTLSNLALAFDNQLAEAYNIKGRCLGHLGEPEQALIEFSRALEYNPNSWEAYYERGRLYIYDDPLKAIQNGQKALSLYQGSKRELILNDLARSYSTGGFIELGNKYLLEKLMLDHDSAAYYQMLAIVENHQGNYRKSLDFGYRALSFDTTRINIYGRIAYNYMFLGEYEKSLDFYTPLLDVYESTGFIDNANMHRYAYVLWQTGNTEKAEYLFNLEIDYCNRMNELGRKWEEIGYTYYDLASVYAFRGERAKAFENLRIFNQRQQMNFWMVTLIKDDPLFDNIRDEPEFQQIVRDVEAKYQAEHERVRQWLEENDML